MTSKDELAERIEDINKELAREYGYLNGNEPHWRVVWSDDQFEKRLFHHTPEGLQLLNPEVREAPKYRQYINPPCYILEKNTPIPSGVETDLVVKTSYEPTWTFTDQNGNNLPPRLAVCRIIIDNLMGGMGKIRKYVDESLTPEKQSEQIDQIVEQLWGNESVVTDLLHYKEAIVVPRNYEKTVH